MKIVPQVVIHNACGTWHGLWTVTSIHSIQKSTRISQELGNKLVSGWQNIHGSKLRKIKLISKKVWRKKREDVEKKRLRSWLLLFVKQYKKLLLKNICHQKAKKNLHSAGRWSDEVASYVCTYWPTINKQTVSTNQRPNQSYSRSSFTRST